MAEGGLLGADALGGDPDQAILDYLGTKSPGFQRAQPALPVTGAAAVGAPQGPVGLAGGLRLVGGAGGPGGQSGSGVATTALSAADDALKAIKFGDLAKTVFGAGPEAGSVPTTSGQLTNTAPEILRGVQFPDFPASAVTDFPGIGIGTGEAVVPTGQSTSLLGEQGLTGAVSDALGISTGAAGGALGAAGAVPGIVMAALSDEPNWEKAVDTTLLAAGGALAGETFGVSALVAGVADLLVHLFSNQQGDYLPKRKEALDTAKTGLNELGGAYGAAAESGDPSQILKALGTTEAGGHVYSGLNLPPDIAQQLGIRAQPGSESVPVDWHSLTPQQFEQFMGLVQQHDPSVLNEWVRGSGDVPYLPGPVAQQAADQAAGDARSLLNFMTQQQAASTPITPGPVAPAATSPGGGGVEPPEELAA